MYFKALTIAGALALASLAGAANAGPVTVTDSISGSAGAWVHDFSLTNNIGGDNAIYFFGVDLANNIVGSPSGWAENGNDEPWNNAVYGGSNITYFNSWCCTTPGNFPGSAITTGQTASGFLVLDTGATATTAINWFAFAAQGNDSAADGHFNSDGNPGFEGQVSAGAGVPEPAAWALMILGFAGVGAGLRSRRGALAA